MDEGSDTYQMKDYRHMQEEPKTDKISNLQREGELRKLQQDPSLTPSTSTLGLRPR